MLDVNIIPEQIQEVSTKKSEIEHKIAIFKEKGIAEKLHKQTSYNTDKTKLVSAKNKIDNVRKAIEKAYEANKEVSSTLEDHASEYNPVLISDSRKILELVDNQLNIIGNAIRQITIYEDDFEKVISKLSDEITKLADEFAAIKREIKDDTLDADTFVQLTNEMLETNERLKQLVEKSKTKENIESAFKEAARQRNNLLVEQFHAYEDEVRKINDSQKELRIEIAFKGDKEGFKAEMKNDFRGSGISDTKYQHLAEIFSDYVALIEDWILSDGNTLKSILTDSEYQKLSEKLKNEYKDLLNYQVKNKVEIYYHNKPLRQHSVGQRASALILFILTQNNNDVIIIDQPEDDLDNKVIYDEIISAILKIKPNIQFIFATHNANIPVLGDAERVFVTDYQDKTIEVLQGNIDLSDTHKQILTTQYRMISNIGNLISEVFYGGRIDTGCSDDEKQHGITRYHGKSILWFDTSGNRRKAQRKIKGGSFINEEEKRIILEILEDLKQSDELKGKDIGIITGYSGQKDLLRKSVRASGYDTLAEIDINTLDAFQGRENDIIIYSTVRTRDSIGFQKEKERVNVAFSRAKKLLIVCGDMNFFYNYNDPDNKFIQIIDYINEHDQCSVIACNGGRIF